MLPDEGAARLPVDVGDLHAARIVHEHAKEVLLRHGRLHDEDGPEQAEKNEEENREANAGERHAVTHVTVVSRPAIGQDRERDGGDDNGGGDVRTGGGGQTEVSLLEDHRPVIEQQPKNRIEHACPPWHEIEPAQAWIV